VCLAHDDTGMMKKLFWVNIDPFDKDLVTAAIEAGADAVVIPEGHHEAVQRLGRITTVSTDGDLRWERDVRHVLIRSREDEAQVGAQMLNVIDNSDWSIIPLENLIASSNGTLIQTVRSAAEAAIALQVMERGADGVLLQTVDAGEIVRAAKVIRLANIEQLELDAASIIETLPVSMSDRCCIDTTSLLPPGEGLLIGNTADALFLVHNENVESPYCAPRPFRVNAGAVHAYVRLPENRTRYLAELHSGDEILACRPNGETRVVAVGRNKIERRPMLLVRARCNNGREVSLILQNAETVRLTSPKGKPLSVTSLQPGDEVLAAFFEKAGRHFGDALDETIEEH